ncbi:unnamed protein product [Didymodactylos carnosus]|uniref:Transmembrane protein n=1 Tax=Didymodactylos carnosus TaxID=1234261 RepID=A0A814W2C1_9BILA|nr:unnamed protein product [Didymodactylos carnosus]CAF1195267.1 unnamed protein product [Didymodactylos carnosus]CAF3769000.1 unnamed protein product [Didymodactylos carnosus]CAF3959663.1 unnamed protein product [Didymodactylos carnosus]
MGFKERFPLPIPIILIIAQVGLTAAIVGIEIRSIYIDLVHGTIWAGFWCGIIFVKTFLAMSCFVCCGRGRCCATYCLILNCISGILACVLIYFDQFLMNNLCKCYLGPQICCTITGIGSFNSQLGQTAVNCTQQSIQGVYINQCPVYPSQKYQLLQAQLGCSVGILITCIVYILTYIFATLGICFGH